MTGFGNRGRGVPQPLKPGPKVAILCGNPRLCLLPEATMTMSFIVRARWVAPVVPAATLLENHCIVVDQGRIAMSGSPEEAHAAYADLPEIDLDTHLLIPGLVNCHCHAAMSLLRGYADDLDMMTWLTDVIWPIEGALVDADFVYDGTRLAAAEMLRTGTTCVADSYFFPESAARAFEEMNIRAQVGLPVLRFGNAWAKNEEDHIHKGLAFRDRVKNSSLITTAFAPHSPYAVTDAAFEKVVRYAEQLELPIHLHLHETAQEVDDSVNEQGARPITRMRELGVMSPALQAVHMTQLRENEIELMATNGCQVVHCPESNLKLASGFCPVQSLRQCGVNVAIGTDGPASNNNLDLIGETRTASLVSKMVSGDASSLGTFAALEMMTINGARFLGLEDKIGSLEAGKLADMVAIDFSDFMFQPMYDPLSQLIYTASGQNVSHVWVGGEPLLDECEFTRVDLNAIVGRTARWQEKVKAVARFQ